MASKSVITRTKIETVLKLEIEIIFGRRILTSRDCTQLSDDIFRKTQFQLNPNTLRRFFGLVKAEYPASLSTLNILSTYCGFRSLDDVDNCKHEESTGTDSIQHKSVLNYLVSLYNNMPIDDANEKIFLSWVKHTIHFLNNNPGLIEKFQNQIIRTSNGLKYYFEHFVNIDKLNSYYGNGLRSYINELQTAQALVFAHSLLVFKYWLIADDENLENHIQIVISKFDHSFDPSVCGRYFAALLYHAHAMADTTEEITRRISNYHSALKLKGQKGNALLSFELIVGEAFILTGLFHEGIFYMDQALDKRTDDEEKENEFHPSVNLFQAIAHYKMGDIELAGRKFDIVKPFEFSFLSKKYLTILYLLMSVRIKRKIAKHDEELASLINELGFKRIETVLHDVREIFPAQRLKKIV